jgi:hypothetical protein
MEALPRVDFHCIRSRVATGDRDLLAESLADLAVFTADRCVPDR